jgi:hypothetical protein
LFYMLYPIVAGSYQLRIVIALDSFLLTIVVVLLLFYRGLLHCYIYFGACLVLIGIVLFYLLRMHLLCIVEHLI